MTSWSSMIKQDNIDISNIMLFTLLCPGLRKRSRAINTPGHWLNVIQLPEFNVESHGTPRMSPVGEKKRHANQAVPRFSGSLWMVSISRWFELNCSFAFVYWIKNMQGFSGYLFGCIWTLPSRFKAYPMLPHNNGWRTVIEMRSHFPHHFSGHRNDELLSSMLSRKRKYPIHSWVAVSMIPVPTKWWIAKN